MGRWSAVFLIFNHVSRTPFASQFHNPSLAHKPLNFSTFFNPTLQSVSRRRFSAIPSRVPVYISDSEYVSADLCEAHDLVSEEKEEDEEECVKFPVKAYFLCTSIDLKSMQAENLRNVVPPTSRSSNYIALRYCDFPQEVTHNIQFLQEVIQNRRSDLVEWGIIFLLTVENILSIYEIIRSSTAGAG